MAIKRNDTYEDILYMPHHVSTRRKQMSLHDRAAQFAPFAALTGHEAAINETARLTESKIQLDENEIQLLDQKLQCILAQPEPALVEITYFLPDARKKGGAYIDVQGKIKKYDPSSRTLRLEDRTEIPIEDILQINFA